jgi:phenylpyruvate tautomerase PptA (4-oxalocrotonate tautomerase family)
MPIVDVDLVSAAEDTPAAGLAQLLADALGRALKSPPGETWVRLRPLARERYAENESILESSGLPVFVTVLRRALPEKAALADEIAALTRAVARVTGRDPASVHVEYAPAAAGRLSFGGRLVE